MQRDFWNKSSTQIDKINDWSEAGSLSDLPCPHVIGLVNAVPGTDTKFLTHYFIFNYMYFKTVIL